MITVHELKEIAQARLSDAEILCNNANEYIMNQLIEKFSELEKELSEEKGEFSLFALFGREDAFYMWDVVISAEWAEKNNNEMLKYLVSKLQKKLTKEEMLMLSMVVVLEPTNAVVEDVNRTIKVKHGNVEFDNHDFNGVFVKHAHILTST